MTSHVRNAAGACVLTPGEKELRPGVRDEGLRVYVLSAFYDYGKALATERARKLGHVAGYVERGSDEVLRGRLSAHAAIVHDVPIPRGRERAS